MNNMNDSIQPDYLTIPLNTSKGVKDSHYINYLPVLNKAIEANNNNPESIIHLLAPMGSGKTTFFKRLLTDIRANKFPATDKPLSNCMLFTPFKISNQEYDEFKEDGLEVKYLIDFAKEIFKRVVSEYGALNGAELYHAIHVFAQDNYISQIILFDEVDFKDSQVTVSKCTMNTEYTSIIADDILVDVVLNAICNVANFNISVSANVINDSQYYSKYNILLNIPVNNYINNFFIYDTCNKRNNNLTLEIGNLINSITTNKDHLLGQNAKVLIYTPKFSKRVFEELVNNGPRNGVLVRRNNIPSSTDQSPVNNPNVRLIGNDNAVLSDEMFNEFDVIGINTSSSRCVSLTNEYENFWVIIIQPYGVTTSCLQSLGRVRNDGINTLWIGSPVESLFSRAVNIDPFFNQYCGINTNVRYSTTLTCPYGIRGLNKPVSRVGERIGDAIGDAIGMNNQATLEVNRILIEWLEANRGTLDAALRDYEVYKIQVVNPCGRAKFQEYHSICKKGGTFS